MINRNAPLINIVGCVVHRIYVDENRARVFKLDNDREIHQYSLPMINPVKINADSHIGNIKHIFFLKKSPDKGILVMKVKWRHNTVNVQTRSRKLNKIGKLLILLEEVCKTYGHKESREAFYTAAAPEMISINSLVMTAWRVLL